MIHRLARRRRFAAYAASSVLLLLALRTPTVQSIIFGGLVELADISERVVRFPCWLIDHSRCFSLDRLDPTCPQCM